MPNVKKPKKNRADPDGTELFCHWCGEEVTKLIQVAPGLWICPDCNKKLIENGEV